MKAVNRHTKLMLRSFSVTMFMLLCAGAVLTAMGYIITIIEGNAYGAEVETLILERNSITIFGHTVNIPFIAVVESAVNTVEKYSPGIIKLLGFAVNGAEELIFKMIGLFG